jgi:SOS-response transcriptional repressor LexA
MTDKPDCPATLAATFGASAHRWPQALRHHEAALHRDAPDALRDAAALDAWLDQDRVRPVTPEDILLLQQRATAANDNRLPWYGRIAAAILLAVAGYQAGTLSLPQPAADAQAGSYAVQMLLGARDMNEVM